MKSKVICCVFPTAVLMVGLFGFSQANRPILGPGAEANAKPLLLEKNEGELRTRRIHTDNTASASSQFTLKVSPKTTALSIWSLVSRKLPPGQYTKAQTLGPRRNRADPRRNGPCLARRSGARSPRGGTGVHSVEYLGEFEEHWHRTDQPDFHLLGARIRGYDAMQFGSGW